MVGFLLFLFFRFALIRYIAITIVPANVNTRSSLLRSWEFETPLAFLIVTLASQSILWPTEEKYVPDFKLSLFEYSKPKASPAEMADEQIKTNIKYVKRKTFNHFSFIFKIIIKLYNRINTCASNLLCKN
jgi:hypothetical protein